MRPILLCLLVACGSSKHGPDAAMTGDAGRDAGIDGAACTAPAIPDAQPASAATACTANSIPGSCIDVSDCTGTRMPTAGRAPAPPASSAARRASPTRSVRSEPGAAARTRVSPRSRAMPGCPAGMPRVDAFCIDRFEAALVEVVDATTRRGRRTSTRARTPCARSRCAAAVPQGYISQIQAGAACAAAGKRLCTDTEWLRACQGPRRRRIRTATRASPASATTRARCTPPIELYGTSDTLDLLAPRQPVHQPASRTGSTPTGRACRAASPPKARST